MSQGEVRTTDWKRNRLAFVLLAAWIGVVLGSFYVSEVSNPSYAKRTALVESLLRGDAKADYVYAMYGAARVQDFLGNRTGRPDLVFAGIDFFGILLMFTTAGAFLVILFPRQRPSWVLGMIWLTATTPLLFRKHFYHPTDFYAVSLMFLILIAARRHASYRLALACFLSGFLWEKAVFVPFFYLAYEVIEGGIKRGLRRFLPSAIATALCFLIWRIGFPDVSRVHLLTWNGLIDHLPRDLLNWGIWLAPMVVVLLDIVVNHWKTVDRYWILWLLYVPLLVATLIYFTHFWGELRTFWILQPIFVGLVAEWTRNRWSETLAPSGAPAN